MACGLTLVHVVVSISGYISQFDRPSEKISRNASWISMIRSWTIVVW